MGFGTHFSGTTGGPDGPALPSCVSRDSNLREDFMNRWMRGDAPRFGLRFARLRPDRVGLACLLVVAAAALWGALAETPEGAMAARKAAIDAEGGRLAAQARLAAEDAPGAPRRCRRS